MTKDELFALTEKISLEKALIICWKELDLETIRTLGLNFDQWLTVNREAGVWHPAKDFSVEMMATQATTLKEWREVFGKSRPYTLTANLAEEKIAELSATPSEEGLGLKTT